ncbi:MAG: lipopolysaccharide heptosyltransferase II [Planctomycetota bacterium]
MPRRPGCERILVMAPSWVGDVVMATPAIRALRLRYPQARMTALARQAGADVLEQNPHLDRIIAANKKGVGPESGGLRELIRLLRREKFDLAVVLPNSFRTALWARLAGAKRRIGYALQWRSLLLTDRLPPPREDGRIVPINMVDRYLAVAARAGCAELSQEEELFASEADIAAADRVLSALGVGANDMLVVLIPGASYGPAKLWGAERFAETADRLTEERGCKVLAHVGPGEEDVGRQVAAASKKGVLVAPPGAIDLKVLKGIIRRSSLVLANDTGPRHYAVAFGVPNVVVLGPTSRRYIDVNLGRTELLQAEVDCGPCQLKVCPRDHECMQLVTPEDVLAAANALLG